MQLSRFLVAPMAFAAAMACAPAFAGVEIIVGNTTNSDTFNRPLADLSDLSAVGTDVKFDAFSFSVTAAGEYTFSSRALGGWDNFLILYAGGFNPSSALTNAVIANDDDGRIGRSGFTLDLQTNTVYTLVTTGFDNDVDFGRYLNRFSGAGDITSPVPEPGPAAMLLAGLAALGFIARRRNA